MKCFQCRRGIAKGEERRAKIVMENGKLKAAYHFNCFEQKKRVELLLATNRMPKNAYEVKGNNQDDKAAQERLDEAKERLSDVWRSTDPEVVALAVRQLEIAEAALEEPRREGWDDYRDTGTAEV